MNVVNSRTGTTSTCCNDPVLTIDDYVIKPFNAICKLTNNPCTLQAVPIGGTNDIWSNFAPPFGDINSNILIKGSFFHCMIGMTKVEIDDVGQDVVTVGNFPTMVSSNGYSDAIVEGQIAHTGGQRQYVDIPGLSNDISITGGFMEPTGHGDKSTHNFISGDGTPGTITDPIPNDYDGYNIGTDYVPYDGNNPLPRGAPAESWFEGTVVDTIRHTDARATGHGNQVFVEVTHPKYRDANGVEHTITTVYSHLNSISVVNGAQIGVGDAVGGMGGSGNGNLNVYPDHIDFQIYYTDNQGRQIQLSPNLFLGELIAVEGATITCPNALPKSPYPTNVLT